MKRIVVTGLLFIIAVLMGNFLYDFIVDPYLVSKFGYKTIFRSLTVYPISFLPFIYWKKDK